jgi:hypothetical protein
MKKTTLLAVSAILALACSLSCAAQETGDWRADSNMAKTITGDISISNAKVLIDYYGFTIAPIRALTPDEVAAAFNADVNAGKTGNLYRLFVPAGRRFLHHNTLCGSDDTQWMATYVEDGTLQVAFFSGPNPPLLTVDALSHSTDICGTFSYVH